MARQNKIESFFTKQDNHLSHEIDEAVVPVDGSLEKYTQPESFSPTEKAVDNSVANQDKSLAAQTNGQNSEKLMILGTRSLCVNCLQQQLLKNRPFAIIQQQI